MFQEAESLASHVEEGVMYEPLPNAQLLQPPAPVYPSDTAWPLLTVAKVRQDSLFFVKSSCLYLYVYMCKTTASFVDMILNEEFEYLCFVFR